MMGATRVVFDTNVLVSFAFWPDSVPWRAVEFGLRHCSAFASPATVREFVRTILYPKFDRYASQTARLDVVRRYVRAVRIVRSIENVVLVRDPKDDKFLDVSASSRAHLLVSGDADLRVLRRFRDTDILSPADFLALAARGALPSS